MGTQVHHTSYLPGYYTMRDLNEDADGCWSRYYEDKPPGRNLNNIYQLNSSNGYSEYDKEMLKRTMLEHEAIFRKQVYELHRLYRTQKDIMNELKKPPCRDAQVDTSRSNSFSAQMPEAATSNNMPHFRVTNDYNRPNLSFLNESSVQSSPVRCGKGIANKDGGMLDSNHKALPKRMFDLQLPADAYIDCEEVERPEKETVAESSSVSTVPRNRIHGVDPENKGKLNLGMTESANTRKQSGLMSRNLTDLNEPAKETCFEKAAASVSAKIVGPRTSFPENHGLPFPMRSNANFSSLPSAFLEGRHHEEGTSSNHLHPDDDETSQQEWPFFNNQAGPSAGSTKLFTPGFAKQKCSMPIDQIQLSQKSHELLSLDNNKRESWFKPKHDFSGRSPHYGKTVAPFANSFTDASPHLSSWTKQQNSYCQVPLSVPSLQCFNGTANQDQRNPSDKWNYSGDLRPQFRAGVDFTPYQNGFNNGMRFDYNSASQLHTQPIAFGNPESCVPQKTQKDVNLNQGILNGFRNGFTAQKNIETEGKSENLPGTLSWLKTKPTFMELDLSQGYPQLKPSNNVMNPRYETRQETEKNINLFNNLQDLPSLSQVKETTAANGQSSKKIFGFAIPEKTQQSDAFSPHQEQPETENDKLKVPSLEPLRPIEELDTKGSSTSLRKHINLNSDPDSSDEGVMLEVPLQVSAPSVASGIDLEAPVVLEEEIPDEDLLKEAAESILLISSDKSANLVPPSPVSYNTLHWFAELVSSNSESMKETPKVELDSFEMLTLNLKETKPEEYLDQKDDDDEGKSALSSLLVTKTRRGQARKRRKRDFQKDILPGLASLSRTEVTQDLQTIGGLMKASGQSWHWTNSRGRVGRRPRSLAVTVGEIKASPPPPPPPPPEIEIDWRNIIGWGRTTRRCRRQRGPPITNVATPLI